jgi:hypothetical protein
MSIGHSVTGTTEGFWILDWEAAECIGERVYRGGNTLAYAVFPWKYRDCITG